MNGDSFALLAEELLRPLSPSLDYLFVAGVAYGASHLLGFAWRCARGIRTYLIPYGRYSRRDLASEFGKWAGRLNLMHPTPWEAWFFWCSPAHRPWRLHLYGCKQEGDGIIAICVMDLQITFMF